MDSIDTKSFALGLGLGGLAGFILSKMNSKETSLASTGSSAVSDDVDVVVVGSSNTDLIAYMDTMPKPGETLMGNEFIQGFGGKGANQCVMAGRLGCKVAMVSRVGDDSFGGPHVANFRDCGVNTSHVTITPGKSTGVAPIFVDGQGRNAIIVVNGANDVLGAKDIEAARPMIQKAKVVVCQLEVKAETSLAALRLAKELGKITIFNPAPARADIDEEFFKVTDIFCPNESEAALIAGMKNFDDDLDTARKAAEILLKKGVKTLVMTCGKSGSLLATKEGGIKHIPTDAVKAIDTTGAGDAFCGALAFFIASYPDLPLEEKIRRSSKIASVSVTRTGTQSSYPPRNELDPSLFNS